jgi:hypothetical protein
MGDLSTPRADSPEAPCSGAGLRVLRGVCLVFGLVNRGAPGAAEVTEPALGTEHADSPPAGDVEPVDAEPVDAKPVPTPRSAADTRQQAS